MTTTDRTASFFDRYASDFNAIYGNNNNLLNTIVNPLFRRSMRLRYQLTLEGCEPIQGASVLDVGCGPGHYSVELARRGASRVLGIDFADGMLEIAKGAAARARVGAVCRFERRDFFKDEIGDSFDYVIAMGFMDYVPDPAPIVRRALLLAKRRAFFSFPIDSGFLAWQRKLRYKRRCDLYLYSEGDVRRVMSAAGAERFDVVQIDRDFFVTAHAS